MDYLIAEAMKALRPEQRVFENLPNTVKEYLVDSQKEGFDETQWMQNKAQNVNIFNQPAEQFIS